jgi:hypothetical protein
MPLTEQEKVKIRHHLGFLNVAEVETFVLGTPAGVETQFIIEGAMNRVLDAALPEIRRQIQILNTIEEQQIADLELLAVNKIGEITVRSDEQEALIAQYDRWRQSLSNLLGVYPNPFDKRGGGINVPVQQ